MTTSHRAPVVDAHVHLWNPARTDWYPYLSHPRERGSGDASRTCRRFDVDTYKSEASRWNVEKFVNVAAATGPHSVEETIELDRSAQTSGHPDAIIGGLPPTDTVAKAIELVDRCMFASNFPVDSVYGTFDDLYATFSALAAGLDSESREKLFASNAERVYRC